MNQSDQQSILIRQPQILCVEGDAAGLALLEAVFTPRGYGVVPAGTGLQALEILSKQPVDLILLDAILPGTDGFTICARIRDIERLRDIPVIMMSALKSREDLLRGLEAGADHYLFKPLDHDEMIARVRLLIGRKKRRDTFDNLQRDMNTITVLEEKTLDSFSPSQFDFQPQFERIIVLLLRRTTDILDKPRVLIAGLLTGDDKARWNQYEYAFQDFSRMKLAYDPLAGVDAAQPGGQKIFFLNNESTVLSTKIILRNLRARNVTVENGICYLSQDLCLMALNYGQEIGVNELNFFRHICVQSRLLHTLSGMRNIAKAFDYGIYALSRTAEAVDDEGGNHMNRVGEYCGIIAERIGMKEDFIRTISLQAILHDIGKIYIPAHILKKKEPLTAEEVIEFRKHTFWGAKIIGGHPYMRVAQMIALNHHERWDGTGYPRGLRGDAIPIEARIAALANQYDALRMTRPYKQGIDHATVTKILNQGNERIRPHHFDPQVLRAYRETAFLFEETYERRKG